MKLNNYTYNTILLPRPQNAKAPALKSNIFDETLHYADAAAAGTPRYDGKISVRSGDNALTAYGYDCHGRLITSTSYSYRGGAASADFSTEYAYDRNANLLNVTRNGIIDNVRGIRTYGINNDISMHYSANRLKSITVTAEGADYEGRTGLPQYQSSGVDFTYDPNGNMSSDAVRGITDIRYNRLNLPVRLTFADGHRQTIAYDGFGRKTKIDYAQGPETIFGGNLPAEQDYVITSSRIYAGPHIFADGQLEYSAFDGGYFNADGSPCYYITDWQGNNAAVVNSAGSIIQSAAYYPYGEPTVEPKGQRFLFGGKEREHAGGRNAYDFGARSLTPFGSWPSPDPKAEDFYQISPFSYCAGDPINHVDIWGLETHALYNDSTMSKFANNYPEDDFVNIVSHGNANCIVYKLQDDKSLIRNANKLIDVINQHFSTVDGDLNKIEALNIRIIACSTGSKNEEGDIPIAQKFSKGIPNAFIYAPDCKLGLNSDGTMVAIGENIINSNIVPWKIFHRGKEINAADIKQYKKQIQNERFYDSQLNKILLKTKQLQIKVPARL